jgi:hypothetical protein
MLLFANDDSIKFHDRILFFDKNTLIALEMLLIDKNSL